MFRLLMHISVSQPSLSNAHHESERRDLDKPLFFQSPDFCALHSSLYSLFSSPESTLVLANWQLVLASWLLDLDDEGSTGTVG